MDPIENKKDLTNTTKIDILIMNSKNSIGRDAPEFYACGDRGYSFVEAGSPEALAWGGITMVSQSKRL